MVLLAVLGWDELGGMELWRSVGLLALGCCLRPLEAFGCEGVWLAGCMPRLGKEMKGFVREKCLRVSSWLASFPFALCMISLPFLYPFGSHRWLFGYGPLVRRVFFALCFGFSVAKVSRYNVGAGFSKTAGWWNPLEWNCAGWPRSVWEPRWSSRNLMAILFYS